VERVVRRRPTRRHLRNRKVRRVLLAVFCAGLAIGCASVALKELSPSLFRGSRSAADRRDMAGSGNVLLPAMDSLRGRENRPIYPYSVVSGGVRDAGELKWAADHDPVVRSHYKGFDYEHARIVRLVLARTAYISYRIGNKVYWTRHRVTLKKGETVITDGKMTARTRCGNKVEEVPQQETSALEPPAAKFDEPIMPATGTAVSSLPLPFESALLNRPAAPGLGPALPLSMVDPFGDGSWTPIAPPPLPGVCGVGKKKNGSTGPSKNGKGNPCESGNGVVPEPGTWLLVATGLAAMYWMSRHQLARS